MPNQLMTMLMNQLKARNPQVFQMVEQARKNNSNPMDMFKQITNNYKPEQLNSLFDRAKQLGVPEEYIKELRNGINTK